MEFGFAGGQRHRFDFHGFSSSCPEWLLASSAEANRGVNETSNRPASRERLEGRGRRCDERRRPNKGSNLLPDNNLAKVGVVGSNPIARSNFLNRIISKQPRVRLYAAYKRVCCWHCKRPVSNRNRRKGQGSVPPGCVADAGRRIWLRPRIWSDGGFARLRSGQARIQRSERNAHLSAVVGLAHRRSQVQIGDPH
ncbi:hypothetical protein SAMN05519104_7075 [Rhizobiales bacterium GAS188]|nr:hypothetical protein SAMN05519104_7075 [Rhizobiales bacterium GAS188]